MSGEANENRSSDRESSRNRSWSNARSSTCGVVHGGGKGREGVSWQCIRAYSKLNNARTCGAYCNGGKNTGKVNVSYHVGLVVRFRVDVRRVSPKKCITTYGSTEPVRRHTSTQHTITESVEVTRDVTRRTVVVSGGQVAGLVHVGAQLVRPHLVQFGELIGPASGFVGAAEAHAQQQRPGAFVFVHSADSRVALQVHPLGGLREAVSEQLQAATQGLVRHATQCPREPHAGLTCAVGMRAYEMRSSGVGPLHKYTNVSGTCVMSTGSSSVPFNRHFHCAEWWSGFTACVRSSVVPTRTTTLKLFADMPPCTAGGEQGARGTEPRNGTTTSTT